MPNKITVLSMALTGLLSMAALLPACSSAPIETPVEPAESLVSPAASGTPQQTSTEITIKPRPVKEGPTNLPRSTPAGIEMWTIGQDWYYWGDSIWEETAVGLDMEMSQYQIVHQYIATYNLRTREIKHVLELPATDMVTPPDISGNKIVWSQAEGRLPVENLNWDVFLLDLDTGKVQQITDEPRALMIPRISQMMPRISGDNVVWLDNRNTGADSYDVYAYNLATGQERMLTDTGSLIADDSGLEISGDMAVWTDSRHADPDKKNHASNEGTYNNEIYAYDLTTNQEKRITTSPLNDHYPDISGENIVWLRQGDYRHADVFRYNLRTGEETQISESGYAAFYPQIDGDHIIWTDARVSQGNTSNDLVINGQWGASELYLYDIQTQTENRLISGLPEDNGGYWRLWGSPAIGGDYIVFSMERQIGAVIYGMKLSGK